MNIFLVEDEPPILRELKAVIASFEEDYHIIGTASNGLEALQYLEGNHKNIDLMITDLHIPVIDGLELLKKTSEKYPYIYCIILTGYSKFEYAKQAIAYRVFDYLLKPIDEEELKEQLKRVYQKTISPLFAQKKVGSKEATLLRIDAYIQENFEKPIHTGQLAEFFGFTPAYLSKLFREYKQITPADYIVKLKMDQAKKLFLEDSSLKIKDVAGFVGYEDSLYFSKVFKKVTGMSPKQFLRNKK